MLKRWIYIIFIIIAVFLISESGQWKLYTDKDIEASLSTVKQEVKDVLYATKEYALKKKEEYQEGLLSEQAELQAKILDLKGQVEETSGAEKEKLAEEIERLEREEGLISDKLDKLGYIDTPPWERFRLKVEKAVTSVKKSCEDILSVVSSNKNDT